MAKILAGFIGFLLGLVVAIVAYRAVPVIIPAIETLVGLFVAEAIACLAAMFIAERFFYDPHPGTSGMLGMLIIRAAFSLVIWIVAVTVVMLGIPMWKTLLFCAAIFAVANATYVLFGYKLGEASHAPFEVDDDDDEIDR